MLALFEPKKLCAVARETKLKESAVTRISLNADEDLKKLVYEFISHEEVQMKYHALALSERNVYRLAGYIPHNYWDVPLEKFKHLFQYRLSEAVCERIWEEWQDSFNNQKSNAFIRSLSFMVDYFYTKYPFLDQHDDVFGKILSSHDVVDTVGRTICANQNLSDQVVEEVIHKFGINRESKLGRQLVEYFYAFCSGDCYLAKTNLELYHILERQKGDSKFYNSVLRNIFSQLHGDSLTKYTYLLNKLRIMANAQTLFKKEFEELNRMQKHNVVPAVNAMHWNAETKVIAEDLAHLLDGYSFENGAQLRAAMNDVVAGRAGQIGGNALAALEEKGFLHEIEKNGIIDEELISKFVSILVDDYIDKIVATEMTLVWAYAYGVKTLGLPTTFVF